MSSSRLDVRYGKLAALTGLNLTLQCGEAICLLGANSAGKTTLLNTLSGFLRPSAGTIKMFGKPVGHLAPHAFVREGLLHVSQERELFGDLTVLDNLRLGSMTRAADRFEQNVQRVYAYFPRLKERAGALVAQGPVGELEKDHEEPAREFYL
jgi:branched-chain amino acid transport system ATP-binding protein